MGEEFAFFRGIGGCEKNRAALQGVPQWLKPQNKCSIYGMAEAMPLTKTRVFSEGVFSEEVFSEGVLSEGVFSSEVPYAFPLLWRDGMTE